MIVPLQGTHLPEVVDLHLGSFPEDFVTGLGRGFLERVFYAWFLIHPAGFGFVWEEGGRLLGYVVGSLDVRSFYGAMFKRRFLRIVLYGFSSFLRRPWHLGRFIEVALALRRSGELPYPADLAYIAVEPEVRGRGIGKRLVQVLLDHVRASGVEGCWVKTRKDLEESNRLYRAAGYRSWREFELKGAHYCIYAIRLQ